MAILLSSQQAADYFGISLSHFKRHVAPHVEPVRIGALVRYQREDIDAWLDAQKAGNSESKEATTTSDSATKGAATRSPAARKILERLRAKRQASTPKPSPASLPGKGRRAA